MRAIGVWVGVVLLCVACGGADSGSAPATGGAEASKDVDGGSPQLPRIDVRRESPLLRRAKLTRCVQPFTPPSPYRFLSIVDDGTLPPADWRPPSGAFPFGYLDPSECAGSAAFADPATACRVDSYDAAGALVETERRDARGRPVERRDAAGTLLYRVRRDASDRVVFEFRRPYQSSEGDLWAYRDDGAIVGHRTGADEEGNLPASQIEVFGCDGRLAELLDAPGDTFPRVFAYDVEGRLAFVGESNGVGNYEEHYLYDERGRLRVRGTAGMFAMRDLQWLDASGRIIRRSTGNDESDSTVHFVYGPAGVTTQYLHRNNSSFKEHGLTRYQYDRAGRLVLWWRATEREDCMIGQCGDSSEAHRITYSCAGARILEEIDRNRDGTADARTTWHERPDDSVEERTWDGAQLTGTKLYRFDCR